MSTIELRANAMIQELKAQSIILGDRAAYLAGDNAELRAENAVLLARIAELEKPKDEPHQ